MRKFIVIQVLAECSVTIMVNYYYYSFILRTTRHELKNSNAMRRMTMNIRKKFINDAAISLYNEFDTLSCGNPQHCV